jgi:hypothetical protein
VQKADAFTSAIDKVMDKKSIIEAPKIIGSDTLNEFAEKLAKLHRPGSFDYAAKFGVQEKASPHVTAPVPLAPTLSLAQAAIAAEETVAYAQPACRGCSSANLSIQYGKFGYYFKCSDCSGNTPIKISCGKDGHKERIRKDGSVFFRECQECGTSSLYFQNR